MKIFVATTLLIAICIPSAYASSIVFDSGQPRTWGGVSITSTFAADDFFLAEDASITSVRLWTLEQPEYAVFDGHVDYKILSTFDQKPYSVLASGIGQSVTHVLSSSYLPWEEKNQFELTFQLQNPFFASANRTYFLAIHLTKKYARAGTDLFYWAATSSDDVGLPAHYAFPESPGSWKRAPSIYWQDYLAFQVLATPVPEPSTLALLALGAVGLMVRRLK